MSAPATRGVLRDGKHREAPKEEEVVLVVSLTDERIKATLHEIEEGLVEAAAKARQEGNVSDLVKLHVHLSKIARRPRGNDGQKGARLSAKKERDLSKAFEG